MLIRKCVLGAALALSLLLALASYGQAPAKPLAEQDLVSLLGLGFDDATVVARIKKTGLAFELNDAIQQKLKAAGASEAVLQAIREAGQAKPAAVGPNAVTYDQVMQMLSLGIDEEGILRRLAASPTIFTLSPQEVAALKQAGATDKVVSAMQNLRASPAKASDVTDLAIILDCSGSMKETTTGGQSKMEVAKRVVSDLVQKIPDGLNVTFVLYGHEVFGSAEDPRNCQAVKIARPLSPLDAAGKSMLSQLISSLKPTGATPIALSLRTAGQELKKNDALCGMVLVTDGLESCGGDPAAEAAALAANLKISFGVNVVGFGVKPEENAVLESIARAGRGKYYAAADAKALSDSIAAIAREIQDQSKPPVVVDVTRRALRILQPSTELPPMKEVFIVEAGKFQLNSSDKVAGITKYGEYLGIPSSTKKYDVVWEGKTGFGVYLMRDVVLPERRVVDVQPASILGMVKVNGTGKAYVFAMAAGKKPTGNFPVNKVDQFGDILALPAGMYDIYTEKPDGNSWRTTLLEEGLQVEPGKMIQLQ
jgi:Mg-chelatase subunit ChlD